MQNKAMQPLKIILHDYAGHAFTAELSRTLAQRGHTVVHAYFAGDPGPKGDLTVKPGDAPSLSFAPIDIDAPYTKANLVRRRFLDLRYGKIAAALIEREKPDVVISANTPTEAQEAILAGAKRIGAKFIYWCQDYYSVAVSKVLSRKFGPAGAAVGGYYTALERRQMRASDAVVLITESFAPLARSWRVPEERLHVMPNWAAIAHIPLLPKDNAWAREHGLVDKNVLLYSGTIGFKHNPEMLVQLAAARQSDPANRVVVVAAGVGYAHLEARKQALKLDNLLLLGLQPIERFAEVLATGDVLAAVIERDAGAFSVPSKVLSYLCAARPVLLSAPTDNLAAKIVRETGAGAVVDPDDEAAWLAAAESLFQNGPARDQMARAGRAYAETNFDLGRVGDRMEAIIDATFGTGAKLAL